MLQRLLNEGTSILSGAGPLDTPLTLYIMQITLIILACQVTLLEIFFLSELFAMHVLVCTAIDAVSSEMRQ
jgi:hypothetical protein